MLVCIVFVEVKIMIRKKISYKVVSEIIDRQWNVCMLKREV